MAAHRVEIIPATADHIEHIREMVRPADRREFAALAMSQGLALRLSLRSALAAWTGTVNGVPVCMFGVSPGEFGEGRPWMIGTKDLEEPLVATIFLRRCRAQLNQMLQIRPVLVNYVSAENTLAIEWLAWLGFIIETPIPWGPRGALFHRFSLRREP